jgi:hypothetical protein
MSAIFALIDPETKHVFHVGCAVDPGKQFAPPPAPVAEKIEQLRPDTPLMVILQSVEVRPRVDWVKWSKRFRRDLLTNDWEAYEEADAFRNSARQKRKLGQEIHSDTTLHRNFHAFDREHPEVFIEMLRIAREKKAQGHEKFGIDAIVTEIRWGGVKIGNFCNAFYARKLQMIDPLLCGLFDLGRCVADELVLEDGRAWREFAEAHAEEIRYYEQEETEEEDSEWTY